MKDITPAFPVPGFNYNPSSGELGILPEPGMPLRDYFAAKAMAALIMKMPLRDRQGEYGISTPTVEQIQQVRLDIAQSAYDYADAMMETR